jgi:hypothetical protein
MNENIYTRIASGEWDLPSRMSKKDCKKLGRDWEAERNFYWLECRRIHDTFKQAVLENVGLLQHPNADKIFDFAWSQGHASGYHEVYNYLDDLSSLFFHNGELLINPRISQRLRRMRSERTQSVYAETGRDLLLVKMDAVTRAFVETKIHVHKSYRYYAVDDNARTLSAAAGDRVRLHKGIGSADNGGTLALP